jgi:dephospho-CoA kinase
VLTLKKVAVTGGVASGKTRVCQILKKYTGGYYLSADEIVHQLLSSNAAVIQKVVDLLGTEILTAHKIDRNKVAEKVFDDLHKLDALEKILHPEVEKEIINHYNKLKSLDRYPVLIVEIPLLFESNMDAIFDVTIAIVCDEKLSARRFDKGKAEFEKRTKRQMHQDEKAKRADFVIANNSDLQTLEKNTKEIASKLL